MHGGGMVLPVNGGGRSGPGDGYSCEITFTVVMSCLMAASGGLIFGGLTQMQSFLEAFFPDIIEKMNSAAQDEYCIFNSQLLTTFVSSLYLAGMLACLVAGHITRKIGRRNSMLIGASLFFVGAVLNCAAANIAMLVVGRVLLGFAVGFTNQSAPVYLAEIAPARWRGAFTSIFHLFLNIGIFVADLVNYRANTIPVWGWRLSLGVGIVPAAVILLGAAFIPDSPNSLVLRGKVDAARASMRRIRGGSADVDVELKDIIQAAAEDRRHEAGAFRRIARREYRPRLVMAIAIPVFFELTGMIVVTLFTPLLFYTLGTDGGKAMPRPYAVAVVCLFTAGFGVSWGPLKWIVPGEIYPLEVRSAGQGMSEAISLALTFAQTQSFLNMLCSFKYGTFAYNAGWVVLMTAFIFFFLPETKGVPIESLREVWARHLYWKRFVKLLPPAPPEPKVADGPL
ncbi:hypothetical protein PVAP13_1KG343700 [Panicum virgatum]|uniref:Major facilitator superfamily (MFS) profile domain-containing protein n=1 Tax=Panicum virgatum TaxID=38727 RepID=A0A8T0XH07_PANVG|nr:hypothetical protein PVAP13_1KG343700 [Panicum virgatum]